MDGDEKAQAIHDRELLRELRNSHRTHGKYVAALNRAIKLVDPESAQENNSCECPKHGRWVKADDVDRMVREIDVALNGEKGAAKQAMLCDVTAQIVRDPRLAQPVGEVDEAMIEAPPAPVWMDDVSLAWAAGWERSYEAHKAALTAARLPAQGGGDAEDTVVARLDAAFKDGYAKGYAASSAEGRGGVVIPREVLHDWMSRAWKLRRAGHKCDASVLCDAIHQSIKARLISTPVQPAAAEPSADAGRDGVDEDFVYLLTTHYETMRNGAISFTPNTHALHCMKAALIATAPAHRQQGDDDER